MKRVIFLAWCFMGSALLAMDGGAAQMQYVGMAKKIEHVRNKKKKQRRVTFSPSVVGQNDIQRLLFAIDALQEKIDQLILERQLDECEWQCLELIKDVQDNGEQDNKLALMAVSPLGFEHE